MHPMPTVVPAMDVDFIRWAALTDEYAKQIAAMARGEKTAREAVARLADELGEIAPYAVGYQDNLWLTV